MKVLINYILIVLVLFSCEEKKQAVEKVVSGVSTNELREYVYKLADDEFEGRGAGYKGEKAAAKYIADIFKAIGLRSLESHENGLDNYIQKFDFYTLDSKPWEILESQNVLGVLKSEENPDVYIVVGAHHDGQGMKGQANLGSVHNVRFLRYARL